MADAGIGALGIDARLLTGQIVNFFIILFILNKYVYKPVMTRLDERRQLIEDSMKKAEKISQDEKNTEIKKQEMINTAKRESDTIVKQAERIATEAKNNILIETKVKQEEIVAQSRKQLVQEKERMFNETKHEMIGMVVSLTEKVLARKTSLGEDQTYVEELLKKI